MSIEVIYNLTNSLKTKFFETKSDVQYVRNLKVKKVKSNCHMNTDDESIHSELEK